MIQFYPCPLAAKVSLITKICLLFSDTLSHKWLPWNYSLLSKCTSMSWSFTNHLASLWVSRGGWKFVWIHEQMGMCGRNVRFEKWRKISKGRDDCTQGWRHTELAKKVCPSLRDSHPGPEADSRNLGHTFWANSVLDPFKNVKRSYFFLLASPKIHVSAPFLLWMLNLPLMYWQVKKYPWKAKHQGVDGVFLQQ